MAKVLGLLVNTALWLLLTGNKVKGQQPPFGQPMLRNCRGEYSTYYRCLTEINIEFNNVKTLPDGQWNQMDNDVKQCFQQASCSHPWGTEAVKNGRRPCFNAQKNRMRQDLQLCVRNYFDRNFDLPQEALDNSVYNRYVNYIMGLSRNQMTCSSLSNRGLLYQCVRERVRQRTTKVRATGNRCQAKQSRCDARINDECYNQWQRYVRPGVRNCVGKLRSSGRLDGYKRAYASCMQLRDRLRPLPLDDPFLTYFNTLSTVFGNIPETCAKRRNFFSG